MKDELNKPLTIISSIIPPIGFIIFFLNRNKLPNKAKKAFGAGLIGIPIGFIMGQYVFPFLVNLFFKL